ncbi:MAG TPA: phosphoglycerate dehydrogenase [Vicinamibacterales bacterium]|nr:phosphoglycerate dehydrogenase [Vicinamibacterales bacterium]
MHIVVADDLPASAVDLLRACGWTVDARTGRSAPELAGDLAGADALIVRSATKVTADLMAAAPRLRVIARAGTGVDNVDVPAASARGLFVMNAPGASSVSVAEQALALMLSLARQVPAADAAMKQGRWEKKALKGTELYDKTLGLVGFGRIGQEVARRALAFGMHVAAHDPFIAEEVARDLGVELLSLEQLCERADYISLHVPSTPQTRNLFNAERLAACRDGVRLINTARGDLIDEDALVAAIESGKVAGAGLDVFKAEPPKGSKLPLLSQVVATPHISASTTEAQELVGTETAAAVRDFLRDGLVRNAVNFPSVPPETLARLQPFLKLGQRLGLVLGQMAQGRIHGVGIRYYGALADGSHQSIVASAVLAGLLKPILSSAVSIVNARAAATERGIELVESQSSRPRPFTSVLSVKLQTSAGERWVEGTVFEDGSLRLVLVDGVALEAPLGDTLLVVANDDQPGVIGSVGTILGGHGINIASFALGRADGGAVGVLNLDSPRDELSAALLDEVRTVPAVRAAWLVRLED